MVCRLFNAGDKREYVLKSDLVKQTDEEELVEVHGETGGFIEEYVQKRDEVRYVDELGVVRDPRVPHLRRSLQNNKLDTILEEWDLQYLERVMKTGGVKLLLSMLAVSETIQCTWLTNIIRLYVADIVRSSSPREIREGLFQTSTQERPLPDLPHYKWVNSVTYNGI